jgi:hypothetical protein
MRVKTETNDLIIVADQCLQALPGSNIPNFRSLIKRPGRDSISNLLLKITPKKKLPIGIIESQTIDNIFMPLQGQEFLTSPSFPELAGPIITPSNEHVPALVKGAVGQGLLMGL